VETILVEDVLATLSSKTAIMKIDVENLECKVRNNILYISLIDLMEKSSQLTYKNAAKKLCEIAHLNKLLGVNCVQILLTKINKCTGIKLVLKNCMCLLF